MTSEQKPDPVGWGLFAAWGLAIVAVGCCAGGPLIAGLIGSVAIGSVLGVAAAAVAVAVLIVVIAIRRRRQCGTGRSTVQRLRA